MTKSKPFDFASILGEGNEVCRTCRFWKPDTRGGDDNTPFPDHGGPSELYSGLGWCKRYPPKLSEFMASAMFSHPNIRQHVDPDDLYSVTEVHDASLYPATWHQDWCGEFQRHPTRIDPAATADVLPILGAAA